MTTTVETVKARLDHPVVDGDGHVVESLPVLFDYVRRVAGDDVAARLSQASPSYSSRSAPLLARAAEGGYRPQVGRAITPWWSLPTGARDRATGFVPRLLHERLDELGIDFTVLYTSVGLLCVGFPDDEVRRGGCRALNTYLAEMVSDYSDRMTAAAVIPTHTPDEAIAELEHAVGTLGFRAVMLNSFVPRPMPGSDARWLDMLALDSAYDYDPLWSRCMDLGVAVTVHSPSMGVGLRQSSSRYMFNHIGNFAESGQAFAKALVFGGVTRRFPRLNFAFLECGVAWGVQLLGDIVGRWQKRGGRNIAELDPARLDLAEWDALLTRYGAEWFADETIRRASAGMSDNPPEDVDDFRASGIEGPDDVARIFERFYFGCEADDTTISWAFADRVNPLGATLHAMLGSDIGHWDVGDMREVVPEAYELVEHELLTPEQFRAFACDTPIRLHGGMNPKFFDGTVVERYARELLATEPVATA
jgi:predicted TIM-barrel fold metal-dependent hydrolase